MSTWKRPDSVPYPSVWSRFEGRRPINGVVPKFWIQDITEDLHDVAVNTMLTNYIKEAPLYVCCDFANDHESVKEIEEAWYALLKHKLAIICFMEDPSSPDGRKVAGLNITCLATRQGKMKSFKGKSWNMILEAAAYCQNIKNPFDFLGIDEYMMGVGLSVLEDFRGQGIGEELLKARIPLGRAVGLKATFTTFSAFPSQRLAEKIGFKDLVVVTFDDLAKARPDLTFPGINSLCTCYRHMYLIF